RLYQGRPIVRPYPWRANRAPSRSVRCCDLEDAGGSWSAFREALGQSQQDHQRVAGKFTGTRLGETEQCFAGTAKIFTVPTAAAPTLQYPLDRIFASDDSPARIQVGDGRVGIVFLVSRTAREAGGAR